MADGKEFDDKCQAVAAGIREAFFAQFGEPSDDMSDEQAHEMLRALIFIHMGEMVECIARFGHQDRTIRDQIADVADLFVKTNTVQILDIAGENSTHDAIKFLLGETVN